jgi:hypothetical protein
VLSSQLVLIAVICSNILGTFEILWAFRSANHDLAVEAFSRADRLVTQLSKRAIRRSPEDEYIAFARWVGKVPIPIGFSYSQVVLLMHFSWYLNGKHYW